MVVDLHPEELLDRHADGTLSEAERARLMAHVATCAACRFELRARSDFADVVADSPRVSLFIDASGTIRPSPGVSVPSQRPRRKPSFVLLGLAAALFAGVSFAAIETDVITRLREVVAPSRERPEATKQRAAARPRPVATAAADETTAKLEDLPVVTPPESPITDTKRPVPGKSASELFRAANDARRDHDLGQAISLYRTLQADYPRADEARLSYATLGRLLLDRGDARGALTSFDQYLSRGGAVTEEALVGRALALQKLGADTREAAAWRDVLRRFPRSIHARSARARLEALGDR